MKTDPAIDEEFVREDKKNINKAMDMLFECLTLNSIEPSHAVHAMINIILGSFKSEELREKFKKVLNQMVEEESAKDE